MTARQIYLWLSRALVYGYAMNGFAFIMADHDLWGHIRFGQEIWESGSIPRFDTFSYTAYGAVWTNHEWLIEVIFYLLYRQWGTPGLLVFRLALGLGIIHILSQLYLRRESNLAVYVLHFYLLIHVMSTGFNMRPQLMTWLCLTLLMERLRAFFDGDSRALAWIPWIMLLWVNCHGGVVAGMGLYALATGCAVWLAWRRGTRPDARIWIYFALSCLMMLVNPYGYKLWTYLYEALGREREITEWKRITLWDMSFIHYKIMAALLAAAWLLPKREMQWEAPLALAAVLYGFKHLRHIVIAGIVLTPYLPLLLAAKTREWKAAGKLPPFSRWSHAALQGGTALLAAAQVLTAYGKYESGGFKIKVDPLTFPAAAVRFMRANGIAGKVLLPFDWGEYVIWQLPAARVSMDGRYCTVYPEKLFLQNLVFENGWEGWRYFLDFYPPEVILANGGNRELEGLKGWVKIYEDFNARVFVPEASRAAAQARGNSLIYPAGPLPLDFP